MDVVRTLLDRFALVPYLQAWGARPTKANEWEMPCPVCLKPKLVVNSDKRQWHCWSCLRQTAPDAFGNRQTIEGAGDLLSLLQLLEGLTRDQVVNRLIGGHWSVLGDLRQIARSDLVDRLFNDAQTPVAIPFPECHKKVIDGAMPYLLYRGLSQDDAFRFGLFWCDGGRYRGRLIFPVYERQTLVYYQGRAMRDARPGELGFRKSLNPPKTPFAAVSDDVLFNIDQAATFDRVGIGEGPIDAVHIGPSAVCSFGKRITPRQIAKLLRAGVRRVDLMWDADAAAESAAVLPFLQYFFDARAVQVPARDPGSYPRWWLTQLRMATPVVERMPRTAAI